MDTLKSLRVFAMVADLKNFSAAAARLELSPAMASKHVMHLEKRVGSRLLNRTSRSVSLTETGAQYLERVRHLLEGLEEAEARIGNTTLAPRGTLKLSAPVWMATPEFARLLAEYRTEFPEVDLEINLSSRLTNLVEEGFDLALRATMALDEGLVARALANIPFGLVASPRFLDRIGRPADVADLQQAPFLAFSPRLSQGSVRLPADGRDILLSASPVIRSENETLLHLAAVEGMGLTFLPKLLVASDVAAGRLEYVLPETVKISLPLYAVYPNRMYLSAKVRSFIDFLVDGRRLDLTAD